MIDHATNLYYQAARAQLLSGENAELIARQLAQAFSMIVLECNDMFSPGQLKSEFASLAELDE